MKIEKTRKMLIVLEILVILAMSANFASALNLPTNVKSSLSGTSLTVSWTAATGATQYRVHVYVNSETTARNALTRYVDGTSIVIPVPSATDCYVAHIRTWLPSKSTNSVVSNKVCGVVLTTTPTPTPTPMPTPDNTPSDSIDNLHNESYTPDSIRWVWTDPATPDFDHVDIYINGIFENSVTKGNLSYTAIGLDPDTEYEIATHTADISGNVNDTWINNTARTDIPDIIPPDSIDNLHNISYAPDHIDWAWTNPTTPDFEQVDIYINGIFKISIADGIETYTATGLNSDTNYEISTHTLDISGNVNNTWKNDTARTAKKPTGLSTIRFITIGDTHITSNTSTDQYKRFTRAVNYVNSRTDIDFVVQVGDIVESGSDSSYTLAKSIISKLNVPYYVLEGNHGSGPLFNKYFGPDEHMEYFPNADGYQLIFPAYNSGAWSFNYAIADKNRPTIIFNHGQVQPKPGTTSCVSSWGSYYSYACSMRPEVDKFTKLLGYYNGHVHSGTHQIINGSLFVTEDNLGGNGADSDFIGYTVIQNGIVTYTTVRY